MSKPENGNPVVRPFVTGGDPIVELARRWRSRLRILVADRFHENLENPWNQALLGKLAHFKLSSYRPDYPSGAIPFGKDDLVGTHIALCEETVDGLAPLCAIKVITLSDCRAVRLGFPAIEAAVQSGAADVARLMEARLARAESAGREVGYIGSGAVHPELRGNRDFTRISAYFLGGCLHQWFLERGIGEVITLGVERFKLERFHDFFGLERLKCEDGANARFSLRWLFDEPVFVSVAREVFPGRDTAMAAAAIQDYWDARIELRKESAPVVPAEAA